MKHSITLFFFFVAFTCTLSAQTPPPPPPASEPINQQEGSDGDDEVPPAETVEVNPDSQVVTFAEVMPKFGATHSAFMEYLQSAIRYPQAEKEAGKQGTVYVSFIVEKDGSVTNCVIVKPVAGAPGLSKEALRVVSASPKWTPGQLNGKLVRVQMTMPVKFILQ